MTDAPYEHTTFVQPLR